MAEPNPPTAKHEKDAARRPRHHTGCDGPTRKEQGDAAPSSVTLQDRGDQETRHRPLAVVQGGRSRRRTRQISQPAKRKPAIPTQKRLARGARACLVGKARAPPALHRPAWRRGRWRRGGRSTILKHAPAGVNRGGGRSRYGGEELSHSSPAPPQDSRSGGRGRAWLRRSPRRRAWLQRSPRRRAGRLARPLVPNVHLRESDVNDRPKSMLFPKKTAAPPVKTGGMVPRCARGRVAR
jgi:hypothetical protein